MLRLTRLAYGVDAKLRAGARRLGLYRGASCMRAPAVAVEMEVRRAAIRAVHIPAWPGVRLGVRARVGAVLRGCGCGWQLAAAAGAGWPACIQARQRYEAEAMSDEVIVQDGRVDVELHLVDGHGRHLHSRGVISAEGSKTRVRGDWQPPRKA